jgi:Galactose oxidase, central domain
MTFARGAAVLLFLVPMASCAQPPSGSTAASPTPVATAASPSATATVSPSLDPTATATPEALAWTEVGVDGPPAREDHTWTVVGGGRTALLFGGRDGATVHGDLWEYDLAADAWTQLTPAGRVPPPRFGHETVWVDGVGLVVFAGQAGATFFNDLWAYDPEAGMWAELPATGDVPVARYGSCAAIGPDGRLWISHGFTSDGVRFSDTRAYDFAAGTWADETPDTGARPVERCLHGCWWTDDGTLALYAGQTTGTTALDDWWVLDGDAWTAVEGTLPPERNLYARVRMAGATLVFGGQALDGSYRNDAWLLPDGASDASSLTAEGAPPGRAGGELVRDVASDRVLLFGGRTADGTLSDLWALTGDIPTP